MCLLQILLKAIYRMLHYIFNMFSSTYIWRLMIRDPQWRMHVDSELAFEAIFVFSFKLFWKFLAYAMFTPSKSDIALK